MKITFTPAKRDKALAERGLDFADAAKIFASREDTRFAYGETRYITAGGLRADLLLWFRHRAATRGTSLA